MSRSIEILDDLIGFASVSSESNLGIVGHVSDLLKRAGAHVVQVTDRSGQKAGLFARIGPEQPGGALLSAHTDVVPVEGQAWSTDPFRLHREAGRLYGRGTADMKGFVACALAAAEKAAAAPLSEPLLLSLSWDEEVGCLGIPQMLPHMEGVIGRPRYCVVGEPTCMQIALGHKGKMAFRAAFNGEAGHSSMAPRHVNALHVAVDFVNKLRDLQDEISSRGLRDEDYDIPYSTIHVGRMTGGRALNIVPDRAEVEFEIRYLAGEDREQLRATLETAAEAACDKARQRWSGAAVVLEQLADYPGLDTRPDSDVARNIRALLPDGDMIKVAYGTEAGYFSDAGIPTVVCGPGNMAQGHKAEEFVAEDQLSACDAFLGRLIQQLCA